jgi:Raf kinase inhibitor-like YbhB/YbcL family protein
MLRAKGWSLLDRTVNSDDQPIAFGRTEMKTENTLVISSPAFKNGELIPKKYTQYNENINPPLNVENVPPETKSLALIVTDLDIPFGINVTHWVMWNIPNIGKIQENSAPGIQGKNTMRKNAYAGPRPLYGAHKYLFKVYALDAMLELNSKSGKKELEKAMEKHILATGELIGIYHK